MARINKEDALRYHSEGRPGKIKVVPTKPYSTQRDLSLAYSPGVAEPCLEIEKDKQNSYKYTAKSNLVAVISNGTAVLGLGNIGAEASKPVMEGKGVLFKIFADLDVFDIEVNTEDVEKFIETVRLIAPTFGGINLEDIKAPECFEIEERLKAVLDIPVMHDDQHGTAIISSAAMLNALGVVGKTIDNFRVVVNGAGASAVACTKLYISLGVKPENIVMCDSKGVVHVSRKDIEGVKSQFATSREVFTLTEALVDADMFLGLSKANVLTQDMIRGMAKDPIVFALANPNPEIAYDLAIASRNDIIFATGRSDYPNQVNNVLGFPYIFRGAMDVHASSINEAMKIAAVRALAELAKQPVPETVNSAYGQGNIIFGRDYLIPKPLDPRLITTVAPAVAKAAIASGVARKEITDWDMYQMDLINRLGLDNKLIRDITAKAKSMPVKVVFAEANNFHVLKAAQVVIQEGIAHPILLGDADEIALIVKENDLDLSAAIIVDYRSVAEEPRRKRYAQMLFNKRQRKGISYEEAFEKMYDRNYFAAMMLELGDADAMVSGATTRYSDVIHPALQIIGKRDTVHSIAGMYIVMTQDGPTFFADTTVNMKPDAKTLVNNALLTAAAVRRFGIEPVMAMVSYSNFGNVREGSPSHVQEAVTILHREHPHLMIDGEMQMNFALNSEIRERKFPFSKLGGRKVNTIIFPNLSSGNIAYKMMQEAAKVEAIGPIILGMNKSVHICQMESTVREIVYMATIAVLDA
ncbi:MAG: hypothetical protein RIS47_1924, partial [Bacteroidota bacterium]